MPEFIGNWKIDLDKLKQSNNLPGDLNDLNFITELPNWPIFPNGGQVDDFSAYIDENRSSVGNYLRVIPFLQSNEGEVNSIIQDGDIVVCMKPKIVQDEQYILQRGWHSEIFHKSQGNRFCISGVEDSGGIINTKELVFPVDWISNIYRVVYPESKYNPGDVSKLKSQVLIWRTIYNKYLFPGNIFIQHADFNSKSDIGNIADILLKKKRDDNPAIDPVTCVQWAYEVLCLSLCFPISIEYLQGNGYYEDFKNNYPDLIGLLPEENLKGMDEIPFFPYTSAQVIQASLDTYSKGTLLIDVLKNQMIRNMFEQFIKSKSNLDDKDAGIVIDYFEKISVSGNIAEPMMVDGKPYNFIYPGMFYCETSKALQKGPDEPWVQYVCTILPSEYVIENK